jgi:CelD/BcsL family acetyltransferase involved in cellulose biosynthesis
MALSVSTPGLEVIALENADFADCEDEWRLLESRSAEATPFLSHDWLSAWLSVYEPKRVALVRAGEADGTTTALGLLEQGGHGRWYFAGAPVTSQRGLLCATEVEGRSWHALGSWLTEHRRDWSTLVGEGVSAAAAGLPSARLVAAPVAVVDLPDSFDAYLAARSRHCEKEMRRKLRVLEMRGLELRRPLDAERALGELARLHRIRAESRNESHPQVDSRLVRMLASLVDASAMKLALLELAIGERTLGVIAGLEYGDTLYAYNSGVDTTEPGLSPGIVLMLGLIRCAIADGFRRVDLGPGEYRYKRELGGVPSERFQLAVSSPTLAATAIRFAVPAAAAARSWFRRRG